MAKSAIDQLLAQSKKKIVEKLDCPQVYGLTGVYTKPNGFCYISSDAVTQNNCYKCWTQKI